MSSVDRESSRDREMVLRHQPSFSDSGRGPIPMWDSSDPDRAPPPLPLNPGSSSPVTKSGASANVVAAAEALAAKGRESMYTTNPLPNKSPEKSLIKGLNHKRMQSLQSNSGVKDLSSYLENPRSPERSPDRQSRTLFDFENRSPERSPTRSGTPTPVPRDIGKEIPNLRPSSRPGLKAILGETPPQSATMRALQGTPTNENEPLSNITNNSTALVRSPQTMDAISNQILGLTNIATRLQQEMAALSRRSKDNATDLVSLKDATNARDEDIRTSLKNLVSGLSMQIPELDPDQNVRGTLGRSTSSYLLEERLNTSPSVSKSISLPRIPSPTSFSASIDREIAAGSPAPYSIDGGASIAILEKVLREMGTKEGQEKVLAAIGELAAKPNASLTDSRISKHLEEVIALLKEQSSSRALVRTSGAYGDAPPQLNINYDKSRQMTPNGSAVSSNSSGSQQPFSSPRAADFVSDDILKLLKRMKDSISEGGGMSAEIKALVRELRGEVLGMGREIGRRLDAAESTQEGDSRQVAQGPGREEISQIVEEGLADLKEHMDQVMKERRRQSSSSIVSRTTVDSQEIYQVVKNALRELPLPQQMEVQQQGSGIEREEILEAVREAWETYKPEIELQNFGLERDEILQCLKEGLEEYKPQDQTNNTYDEVLDAVKDGLRDFKPTVPVETEASLTREEILVTVRECLESFEFPSGGVSRDRELAMTKEDVLDAVKEGMSNQAPMVKEVEFNRDDLFDAVKAGLEGAPVTGGVAEEVMDKMQDLIDGMRGEFQQYSAANGRDTEQVLDAMKDGLEVLRTSIETYVDRAADVTGKDEIIETVRSGMDQLRVDLESTIANAPRPAAGASSGELLDVMEKEFEHLRSTISSSVVRGEESSVGKEELLDAIRDGFDDMRDAIPSGGSTAEPETLATVQQELQHLRETLANTMTRGNDSFDREELLETIKEGIDKAQIGLSKDSGRPESVLSNTSELLDHFNDGLDNLKVEVERIVNKPIDMTVNYEILETLKEGLASVRADIDSLKDRQPELESAGGKSGGEVVIADEEASRGLQRPDIEKLEVMIAQLNIKVESLDNMPPPPPSQASEETVAKSDVEHLESLIKEMQHGVAALVERKTAQHDNTATKEDTDAIETLLRNTKAHIEDLAFPEPEGMARVEHMEALETLLKNTKDAVEDLAVKHETDSASKEDMATVEIILKDVQQSLTEMRERSGDEPIAKSDIEALATLCTDNQAQFKGMLPEGETLPTKGAVEGLRELVQEFQDKFDADAEMTAQAFDARKTEHGGLADKIEDVKAFLDSVRNDIMTKVEADGQGIQELVTSIEAIGEAVHSTNSSTTVTELKEILEREFEKSHSNHEAATSDFEQYKEVAIGKHDDHKAAIIEDLTSKIDARFDELMIKYDDAQLAADAKAAEFEEKANDQAEAVASARAVTDDLKLLVDTLGTTVTESCDRMGEDTRTVYTKVDDLGGKVDETLQFLTIDGRNDHQATRAEISKTMVAVEGLQAHTSEYNPKIMSAITEVLCIVGQHYEEAQKTSEEIKTSVNAIPGSIPVPALPAPQEPVMERLAPPTVEKYDDAEVHAKLDQLVNFATEAGKSAAQFEMLEEIKSQVTTTASEFQTFMNAQQATIIDMQESRAREAEEVGIALEKRTAQKEVVESDIVRLSDERSQLETSVKNLKTEERQFASIKAKLQSDVQSLEMALSIRREEMELMESRAQGLERRILDGVLDHSRALLINSRPKSTLDSMNRKRVPSTASSNATVTTTKGSKVGRAPPSNASSVVNSAVGMAMKKRQPNSSAIDSSSPAAKSVKGGNRRVLSLSTVSSNKGHPGEKSMILTNPSTTAGKSNVAFGGGGLKRSHSVKSNFPARKTSWGGTKQLGMFGDDLEEDDKENSVLEEEEDEGSDRGTDRRTSYTGTYTGTDVSYGTGSYGTGSVTDSNDDRRTSYAASIIGTVNGEPADEDEKGKGAEEGQEADAEVEASEAGTHGNEMQLYQSDFGDTKHGSDGHDQIVRYGMPNDSGLGSDLPTAALDGNHFFKDQSI